MLVSNQACAHDVVLSMFVGVGDNHTTPLSRATSSCGTSLFTYLVSGNHDNILVSPFSVYAALAMTLLGAEDDTEQELKE